MDALQLAGVTIVIVPVAFLMYYARAYFWNHQAYLQSDHHSSPKAARDEVIQKLQDRRVIWEKLVE